MIKNQDEQKQRGSEELDWKKQGDEKSKDQLGEVPGI
jgi:hypothetical protein